MPNAKKVAHQWLETDAAFGVDEVPLPRPKRQPAAARKATAAPTPATRPVPRTASPAPAFVPPKSPAAPARPAASAAPARPAARPTAKPAVAMPPIPAGNITDLPPLTKKQKADLLEALRLKVCEDSRQYINTICTKVVFGEGDPDAPLMFIGEGPGIEEDKTGRPFVGRSGQLLDKMIAAMGLKRDPTGVATGVYIANVVKLRCADPDETNGGRLKDRPPTPEEASRGLPILHQQIEIIRPKVIVTLGAPAIKHLTGTTQGVMSIRGTWLSFRGIPVMPTYHPSFLLRAYTEENRRKVWNDLQLAMKKMKG